MDIKLIIFSKKHLPNSHYWFNDKDFCRSFGRIYRPFSLEDQKDWFLKVKKDKTQLVLAIEVDGVYVGNIGLKNIDYQNKKAEYYIFIGNKDFRGKGIGTISSQMFFTYLKKNLKINKVYLHVDQSNTAAKKLYQKIGFKKEGVLKDEVFSEEKFHSLIRMAYFLN